MEDLAKWVRVLHIVASGRLGPVFTPFRYTSISQEAHVCVSVLGGISLRGAHDDATLFLRRCLRLGKSLLASISTCFGLGPRGLFALEDAEAVLARCCSFWLGFSVMDIVGFSVVLRAELLPGHRSRMP